MDTSLSIHPDNFTAREQVSFADIGDLIAVEKEQDAYLLRCAQGYVSIQFIAEHIVRIVMNASQPPNLRSGSQAVRLAPQSIATEMEEQAERIVLSGGAVRLEIGKAPVRIRIQDAAGNTLLDEGEHGLCISGNGELACYKRKQAGDRFYGFGEKSGYLDKNGTQIVMWNTDVYAPHNPETDPLYVSIPFYMTNRGGNAFGVLVDNTGKTTFDLRQREEYCFVAEGGQLAYYFIAGPTLKEVVSRYTALTGRAPLWPKWAFGYHQSRFSYETEEQVRLIVRTFREKRIPLDAIYLDIHYMDGYRVFTVDRSRFPNFEQLIKDLLDQGVRVVPIVDPGVKEDAEYAIYAEGLKRSVFCKKPDGSVFYGPVWPGNSAFPDFSEARVREWWGKNHKEFVAAGIEGIWNDMNEPSVFQDSKTMDLDVLHGNNGEPAPHQALHNAYGQLMAQSTYEGLYEELNGRRPFVLTRAGYAGIQRYAAVWTGDNRSFWEHLQMAIPMCLNLGLSGVAMAGADVGGFAFDANGELLVRWTQAGAFFPFFRNHSEIKSVRQEPWAFGEEIEKIVTRYIELRYRWLPHFYNLQRECALTGMPLMRPLVLEYPDDANTYNLNDQFLIGDSVLIAPVMQPDMERRLVYLPAGDWVDYWTNEHLRGGRCYIATAPLDTLPIYIKSGAVIFQSPVRQSTKEAMQELAMYVYFAEKVQTATYRFYDDDGETINHKNGEYYEESGSVSLAAGSLEIRITIEHDGYTPEWKRKRLLYVQGVSERLPVVLNGQPVPEEQIHFAADKRMLSISLADGK